METKSRISKRLKSLDALRGFDMFFIIGGDMLFRSIAKVSNWQIADWLGSQMHHVEWEGFHAYDLVFPLFMFISGVSIPFALESKIQIGKPKTDLYAKIFRRAIVLVLLGIVYNGFFSFNFEKLRIASVLGQIGLAYMLASLISLNATSIKKKVIFFFGIITGYAFVQLAVPFPGGTPGTLTPTNSINGYIDQLLLPGRLYGGTFDPEGILCIISASAITLLGSVSGTILRNDSYQKSKKVLILGISGALFVIIGYLLSGWYPLIKSVWTSTFNLFAGGLSLLLLCIFYLVIDVWKIQKWSFFFQVIGLNSITIYMAVRVIDFRHTSNFFMMGSANLAGDLKPVLLVLGIILLEWLFLYFLYRKRIFLKV